MAQKKIKLIENFNEAGELISRENWMALNKAKVPYKNWSILNIMNCLEIAQNENISKSGYRVLFYCLHNLEYDNIIVLNKTDCSRELNLSIKSVLSGVSELLDANILIKTTKKIGNVDVYHLNPYIFWRGESKEWLNSAMPILRNIDNPEKFKDGLKLVPIA